MQDTMVTESEPLIAIDKFPAKIKTTQDISAIEKEQLLMIDDFAEYKQKILMKQVLIMVIVVNLIVLISIILFT